MLTSISPLGERARGNRFWVTATAYAVGSLLGGAAIGVALGALGDLAGVDDLDEEATWWLLAAGAVVGAVLDATGRLPTVHRQVDERWLGTYRGWVYGFGYGIQLGSGVATIVTASVTYLVLLAAFLTGSAAGGLAIGVTYGLARSLPLLVTSRVRTTEHLAGLHRRLDAAASSVARGTWVAQVAAVLLVAGMAA